MIEFIIEDILKIHKNIKFNLDTVYGVSIDDSGIHYLVELVEGEKRFRINYKFHSTLDGVVVNPHYSGPNKYGGRFSFQPGSYFINSAEEFTEKKNQMFEDIFPLIQCMRSK